MRHAHAPPGREPGQGSSGHNWPAIVGTLTLLLVGLSMLSLPLAPVEAQDSPLDTPTATDTPVSPPAAADTPAITPTPTLTTTPTATLPEATVPTETDDTAPLPPGDGADDTATNTPEPLLLLPPVDRPIEPPTGTPPVDILWLASTVLDGMATAAGWIWFICGSLIFFVVAGVIAGMIHARRERMRYDLYRPIPEPRDTEQPVQATEQDREPDDIWPAGLP